MCIVCVVLVLNFLTDLPLLFVVGGWLLLGITADQQWPCTKVEGARGLPLGQYLVYWQRRLCLRHNTYAYM